MRPRADAEERFCDAFAAALLLPATWVVTTYGGSPRTLATLRHLADHAEASLAASVVRVNELLDWSCALFRWQRDSLAWRLAAAAGVPPPLHGQVSSSPKTPRLLADVAARGDRVVRASLPMMVRSRPVDVDAEISVLGRTAIALLDLRSLALERPPQPRTSRATPPPKPHAPELPLGRVLSVQIGLCACGEKTARGLVVQGVKSACWETRASAASKIAARSSQFYVRVDDRNVPLKTRPCPRCGAPDRLVALQGGHDRLVTPHDEPPAPPRS